ncbi:hypothetical protein [Microbulbifer sp. GL-2]|uniref:hypothetical protein n=1 Tax=Microbulbifer sp. GL-2 TaxID=2591606 RepID=UPI0011653258|nr:hypothetical protein [Microbulbifer sp. GL-2]BBM00194.1 hypothetical protein GL2_02680 [Microbulbifer sp. GL-2]
MNTLYVIGALLFSVVIYAVINHIKMKKLSRERGKANICQYVKSFDCRNVDTKIMREVWNEVQLYLGNLNGKPFPILANDMFEGTYNMHPDDLDDIYWAVADRLGIDTGNPEQNPYFNQVTSVKNLVLFLNHQPRSGIT